MAKPKLIGLSLGKCCAEMAEGKVDPKDVKLLITSTSARTPEAFEEMLQEDYRAYRWPKEIRNKAARIARKFYREGRLEQPRITQGRCPDFDGGFHRQPLWVTNRKKIVWRKESPSPEKLFQWKRKKK